MTCAIDKQTATDDEIVARVLAGETALYELIVRRYNRRLYRIARAMVRDDQEAEDIVQHAYVRAFEHLSQFEGRALFSTWLTKIAVHEAWNRLRRRQKQEDIESPPVQKEIFGRATPKTPEDDYLRTEARSLLEAAIDRLPESYRSVFVIRALEDMSTAETAKCLDISEETVKIRLLRARRMLRREMYERAQVASAEAFLILGKRCDRLTSAVLARTALAAKE